LTNTAENKLEFKNENVEVAVYLLPGCLVKFEINVSPKAAEAAYFQAIKIVKKEISLPGFRKGKAPDSLVIQNYGTYVDREFRDCVIQTGFREALKESKIYPFNEKSVKRPQVKSCSREAGAIFTIEFESEPRIPSVNPAEIHLKNVEKHTVTDQDVNDTIEDIRYHHASWDEITDRPVEEGDFVELDIDALSDPAHNICQDSRFEVNEKGMADWMRKLVVGMKIGDHVEGMSEKQHDDHVHTEQCNHESHAHEDNFKPTLCRITLKAIKKPNLPPVDDQLAIKVGLKTADEIFPKVKADLERQADERRRALLRKQMDDALLQHYPFEVPESIVDAEFQSRLKQKIHQLERMESADSIKNRRIEIAEEVRRETRDGLKLFYITRKAADEHKIQVSQNELLKEFSRQMWTLPPEQRSIDAQHMKPEEVQSRLYLIVLAEKAKDYLVEQAQIDQ
jgi:trigger factor